MSFSNLYTSRFKTRNRDHFAAIVSLALADGKISDEEQAFINRTAINLEIDEAEVDNIIKNINDYPINPPASKQIRLERLYDLTRMIFTDNIADEAEKQLMNRLVIGLGFEADNADYIIKKSFEEVLKGSDEDEFIAAFLA
jgi:predicted NUDIX family phosphoesterase